MLKLQVLFEFERLRGGNHAFELHYELASIQGFFGAAKFEALDRK
jgi:hypothetical protein